MVVFVTHKKYVRASSVTGLGAEVCILWINALYTFSTCSDIPGDVLYN